MNKTYRLVWDERTGTFAAVSELTSARGKRSRSGTALVAASLLALTGAQSIAAGPAANALPTGGSVVGGSAAITQSGARMDIVQSTNRAAVNWQRFDVGSGAHVNFQQPSSSAVTVNRVISADPSSIHGRITANGQVWLLNPNGVAFGKDARVDVGGMVASSMSISDADFMAGKNDLQRQGAIGAVVNEGTLTAGDGGYIALLAPEVRNQGVISARMGSVALAAGDAVRLDISGASLISIAVDAATIATLVENRQLVQADGGKVFMSAQVARQLVNSAIPTSSASATGITTAADGTVSLTNEGAAVNRGTIQAGAVKVQGDAVLQAGTVRAQGGVIDIDARSADFDAGLTSVANASGQGGRIRVSAQEGVDAVQGHRFDASGATGGTVRIEGGAQALSMVSSTIAASGSAGQGGQVQLSSGQLALFGAQISADGATTGGKIHVGGGWKGEGDLPLPEAVYFSATSSASAKGATQGGDVTFWSKGSTDFYGAVDTSSSSGPNGGRIEVSSKGSVEFQGTPTTGAGGQLLLDPKDLVIVSGTPISGWQWLGRLKAPSPTATSSEPGTVSGSIWTAGLPEAIVTTPGITGAAFGSSLAMEGDLLAVGAPGANSVYLFNGVGSDFGGLALQKTLKWGTIATTNVVSGEGSVLGSGINKFGSSIALSNGKLAVVARDALNPTVSGNNSPAGVSGVYLFDGVSGDLSTVSLRRAILPTELAWESYANNRTRGVNDTNGNLGRITFYPGIGLSGLTSVAMDGNVLVLGAAHDGVRNGPRPSGPDYRYSAFGQVYLIKGMNDLSQTPVLVNNLVTQTAADTTIQTLTGQNLIQRSHLGSALAVKNGVLAVGAAGSKNSGDADVAGTVYLYRYTTDFATLTYAGQVQNGAAGESFGSALALSGNKLLVGASGANYDNRSSYNDFSVARVMLYGNITGSSGAISPSFIRTFSNGSTVTNQPTLGTGNLGIGGSIAYDDTRQLLAFGTPGDAGGGSVALAGVLGSPSTAMPQQFSTNPSDYTRLNVNTITALLNAGTDVTLQANNDMVLAATLNATGGAGDLTMQAGRHLLLNGRVQMAGDFTAIAGDVNANSTYTGSGTPMLRLGSGVTINSEGDVTLVADSGGKFVNASNKTAPITADGRWLVYSNDPRTDAKGGMASDFKHYGCSWQAACLDGFVVPSTGNGFLHAVQPTMLVTPGAASSQYGDTPSLAGLTYTLAGLIDGDTQSSVGMAGTATFSTVATASSNVGTYDTAYGSGLTNSLGYLVADNTASVGEYRITPRLLAVATAQNKVYDGTKAATLVGFTAPQVNDTISGTINGDVVTVTAVNSPGGEFATKNAGTGINVAITGVTLSNANYMLGAGAADITPAAVTFTGSKTYDGNSNFASNRLTLAGAITGDTLSFAGAGTVADKNAAVGKFLDTSGLSLSGASAANYYIDATPGSSTATITPKSITASLSAQSRVYDGTTTATGTLSSTGMVAGDDLSLSASTTTFANKNAGSGKIVTASGIALSGNDALNYSLTATTATATANITKAGLVFSGASVDSKVYDGTTTATVTSTGSLTGVAALDAANGELMVNDSSVTGAFADRHAGNNKQALLSGYNVSGTAASNYDTTIPVVATGNITPKNVSVSGTRVYDGTATADSVNLAIQGVLSIDTVSLGGQGTTADKNVGVNKTVDTNGLTLGGLHAGNYQFDTSAGTSTLTITPKALTVANVTASTRTYDGTTGATLDQAGSLVGVVVGDGVEIDTTAITGTFVNRHASTGKTVNFSGFALQGTDAQNYSVVSTQSGTGDITPRRVVVTGASASDKVYDGNRVASVTGGGSSTDFVADDLVNGRIAVDFSQATGEFSDKNAAQGKSVAISGLALTGADSQNYQIDTSPVVTAASITPRALSITGTSVTPRDYDGTTSVTATSGVLQGLVAGESLGARATGTLDSRNAGQRTATVAYVLENGSNGELASNYSIGTTSHGVTVGRRKVVVTGTEIAKKVYDGTTTAVVVSPGSSVDFVATDVAGGSIGVDTTTAIAEFTDRHVGVGKAVAVRGLTLVGTDASNYEIDSVPARTVGTVTPKQVTVVGSTAAKKVYDGKSTGALNQVGQLDGVYSVDEVGVDGTGSQVDFLDVNAGTEKAVVVRGMTLVGPHASNYQVASEQSGTGTIDRRPVRVTGTDTSKYSGGGEPALRYSTENEVQGRGLLAGEALTGVLQRAGNEVPGKYSITAGTLTNANNPNYDVDFVDGVLEVFAPPMNAASDTLLNAARSVDVPRARENVALGSTGVPLAQMQTTVQAGSSSFVKAGRIALAGNGSSMQMGAADNVLPSAVSAAITSGVVNVMLNVPAQLVLARKVADLPATEGTPIEAKLPAGTFQHGDARAQITLTAQQADGSPLPQWLSFDAGKGLFTGVPPQGSAGVAVKVVARDNKGGEAETGFVIDVRDR